MDESLLKEQSEASQREGGFEASEFQERVDQEKKEARERFGDLIELVNQRYESGILSPAEREKFGRHNEEVLDYVVELGLRKELGEDDLKIVEIAAILHDLTKADELPEEFADIPNYGLVTHGQRVAVEVEKILTDERLERYGFENYSPDEVRAQAGGAIAQHMGPHPGFMTEVLEGVNRVLEDRGLPPISHPPAQGRISETLLAADMASLASAEGRKKVLVIRANNEFLRVLDSLVAEDCRRFGLELGQGEVALLSAFESAGQAVEMITDPDDRRMLEEIFEASKGEEYRFGDDPKPIRFEEAWRKREEFEAKMRGGREGAA